MKKVKVYFHPLTSENPEDIGRIAKKLFETVIKENNIILEKNLPLKVHPGEPGNTTFIKPAFYNDLIDFLIAKGMKPFFIETNTVTGQRTNKSSHLKVAKEHGFTRIPVVIADGEIGNDQKMVAIKNGKYFKSCRIAAELANKSQVVVLSHFKGHVAAGFGAALKMLGIGFASRQGKMEIHSKEFTLGQKTIDWSKRAKLFSLDIFRERMVEYALAAVNNKQYIYLTFAFDMTDNCDCDGEKMEPVYSNLGIFASLDPVAIDKACFDMLEKREGKKPFDGENIFAYAEKLGLGSQKYTLQNPF
jgi:uncharacterized Fe-S center protein